jgi:hypothetical protein
MLTRRAIFWIGYFGEPPYVLVAIVKKELGLERSLSEILQILSLTLFEKIPIFQALSEQKPQDPEPPFSNQLNLFDL